MKIKLIACALFALLVFLRCSRPSSNDVTNTQRTNGSLSITTLKPLHGPYNTIDTIIGTNFGTDASSNTVLFNGKQATIISASTTQLIVNVPKLCGTGPVSVAYNGQTANGPVFTYDTTWMVTTLAGNGSTGRQDGTAASASFNNPMGIAVDSALNVYVVDHYNDMLRKISPAGIVSTLSGTNGAGGYVVSPSNPTTFPGIFYLCIDPSGNLYASNNAWISKITPNGVVSFYAGNGNYGNADGPALSASFTQPQGVCLDAAGNLYISDYLGRRARKISAAGIVSTIAGNGSYGDVNGPALSASFYGPIGIAVPTDGTIYVVDGAGLAVRKISGGMVSALAGQHYPGNDDGIGTAAKFQGPSGCTVDKAGNLYVADVGNNSIRKITSDGTVKRFAGGGVGSADGPALLATFQWPNDITIDKYGNFYVTDGKNNNIRKISYQ